MGFALEDTRVRFSADDNWQLLGRYASGEDFDDATLHRLRRETATTVWIETVNKHLAVVSARRGAVERSRAALFTRAREARADKPRKKA